MKNSAFLALMEQLIMTLVFALAAALCLQVFIFSEQMSLRSEAQSHALIVTQTAAEAIKASRGDLSRCSELLGGSVQNDCWSIQYDDNWNVTDTDAVYELLVEIESESADYLQSASCSAQTAEGEPLFFLSVSWQEVNPHE